MTSMASWRRDDVTVVLGPGHLIGQFELFVNSESGTTTVQNEEQVPCHEQTSNFNLPSQLSKTKNSFVRPLAKI